MSDDDDQTIGTTLPAPPPDQTEMPRLATFDHPAVRFELGEEIGRGGMGRVVAATDVSLARSVAIKQVLSNLPDDLVRFEREVRITAELEHPSIVPIHEAARGPDGKPYYVMRRIEGDPLSARMKGTLLERLTLLPNLLAVVDAAAFAHARNIIHRDIKPSNILLGAYGETHLIDWGLARKLDDLDVSSPRPKQGDQLTRVGHVYGTVAYMAPEQARGEAVDARADVYALGATLFHVLAAHAPFAHMSDVERLAAAVTGDDHVPIDKLGDDIPPELIAIVEKAMQHDRDQRYEHAGELAADLRAFLAGKLVGAHRYSTGERVRRFVRKHRFAVIVSVASVIAVSVIAVIAVTGIIAGKNSAEAAKLVADQQREAADERAELLAIQRASALAPHDPTRAAALLLELDPNTSHHPTLTRDAIARIATFGISRGAAVHHGPINGLAFSPDSTQLASVGADGLVVLYQVANGTTRKLASFGHRLSKVAWTDDHTLLVVPDGNGATVIDVPTGASRPVPAGALTQWWQVADRVRYFDRTQQVLAEISLAGGPPRELARGVDAGAGTGEIAVFHSDAGMFVLDHDQPRPLSDALPKKPWGVAVRPDGKRVAASWSNAMIEWDVATGRPTQRWQVDMAVMFEYAGDSLVVFAGNKDVMRLYPTGRVLRDPVPSSSLWGARVATGVVVGMASGFRIYDASGSQTVAQDQPGLRVLAGTPDRMVVAMGSMDGTVRWLDLDALAPRPIPVDRMSSPCAASDRFLYAVDPMGLSEIDMRSGAVRRFDVRGGLADCIRVGSRVLLMGKPAGVWIFDPATVEVHAAPRSVAYAYDRDLVVYAVDSTLYELAPDARAPRAIYTAPAEIDGLTLLGDRMVIVLRDRRAFTFDRTTGGATPFVLPADDGRFGLLDTGGLWYSVKEQLFTSDGTTVRRIAPPFEQAIATVFHRERGYYVQLVDGSLSFIDEAGVISQRIPPGRGTLLVGPEGMVVETTPSHVTAHYLDSGEQITRDHPMSFPARLVMNGRGTLIRTIDHAIIYVDPVPANIVAAHAWLSQATNARIRTGTGAFHWQ